MPINNSQTPIAIFVYNRPFHTQRLLDSLENCARIDNCPIFIFCDGWKNSPDKADVQSVRDIIKGFASKRNVIINESSKNLGLSASIIKGVSQVCDEFNRIIVLEDDLVLHPQTLNFMMQGLDRYENDPQVGHICGFSFPIEFKPREDALLLPLFNTWGWATWSQVWKNFEWTPDKALHEMNRDANLRTRLYPYYDHFFYHYCKKEMTWGLLWHWKLHSLNKIGVFPSTSLIWCSGFDASATHTGSVPDGYQSTYEEVMANDIASDVEFPETVRVDPKAAFALRKFLRSKYAHPMRMFYRRARDLFKAKFIRKSGW